MAEHRHKQPTNSGPSLPAHATSPQLVKRADELVKSLANRKELYRDTEAWALHQELAKIYRRLLVTDLRYSLDRKLEQQMWSVCFKNYITHLQAAAKDKRNKNRAEAQVTLAWFLENASGFYILLLEEIRLAFSLDVPFLQSGAPYGMAPSRKPDPGQAKPSRASCNYICQHCLVHLGDIARYRSQAQQAESFYRHAISMAASSGQPYNQIALLEASRGNKLSTVYFYMRAISLSFPFPAASINLSQLLSKLGGLQEADNTLHKERTGRVTAHTFIPLFLRLQGLLHHQSKLRHVVKTCSLLTDSLTSLIASDSFSTWQLLQLITICMWVWEQAEGMERKEVGEAKEEAEEARRLLAKEERLALAITADLLAAFLSAALLPVYTLKTGAKLVDYVALPAARLVVEWVWSHPSALHERGFASRPQIWPGLARLLNEIEPLVKDSDTSVLQDDYPLPEDYDLQSFRPLSTSLAKYNFQLVARNPVTDQEVLGKVRFTRLLELGRRLTGEEGGGIRLLARGGQGGWSALEPEPSQSEDAAALVALIEEEDERSEDEDDKEEEEEEEEPQWDDQAKAATAKGILKPAAVVGEVTGPRYRARHNVAMAAILRANQATPETEEERERRVAFRTPSPTSTQGSASQEMEPVTGGHEVSWRDSTAPEPLLPPTNNKMSLNELDLTRPPPSLHSNFRPPKLTNSPPVTSQQGLPTPSLFAAAEPAGVAGILPIQQQQLQQQHVYQQQRQQQSLEWPTMAPPAGMLGIGSGQSSRAIPSLLANVAFTAAGQPQQRGSLEYVIAGQQQLPSSLEYVTAGQRQLPGSLQYATAGQQLAGSLEYVRGGQLLPQNPVMEGSPTYPNISGLNLGWPTSSPSSSSTESSSWPTTAAATPPSAVTPPSTAPPSALPAAYSLFSPSSGWPGPLLTQPTGGSGGGASPRGPSLPGPIQQQSPSRQLSSNHLFGPSPLERLLHQNKPKQ